MNDTESAAGQGAPDGDASPAPVAHSVKRKVIEAVSFIFLGFGLSQVLRLAGNVALTRILMPEKFGIISLARVFVTALYLFSDVGLEHAMIRSKRSDDDTFMNTAWTVCVIRSGLLALLSAAIAVPVAMAYGQPVLAIVIPLIGFFGMITGFESTSLTRLERDLQQKRLTIMELVVQIVSLGSMVVAALLIRDIWALLVGDLVGSVLRLIWSHAINRGHPNRFRLEKEAIKELLSFGKWILASTAMMFLATQADRILLGKLFPIALFGVYGNAVALSELPKQVVSRLAGKVIFPVISRFAHEPRELLRDKIRGPRLRILLLLAGALALFACTGDFAVRILFNKHYQDGAWILPILSFGMWPLLMIQTIEPSLFAIGKPKYSALGNLGKFIYMVVMIPLSYRLWGIVGAVVTVALNDLPAYLIVNYGLSREKLAMVRQDVAATLFLAAASAALIGLRLLLGLGLPGQAALMAV